MPYRFHTVRRASGWGVVISTCLLAAALGANAQPLQEKAGAKPQPDSEKAPEPPPAAAPVPPTAATPQPVPAPPAPVPAQPAPPLDTSAPPVAPAPSQEPVVAPVDAAPSVAPVLPPPPPPPPPAPSVPGDQEAPTASLLAKAGYPLTPGVSADPFKPDFVLSGYLQAQFETHQDSVNQLNQSGGLQNQDRFVLRRGRLRVTRDWDFGQVIVELDGNTKSGPTMRVQKAEASLIYRRSKDRDLPPVAQLTFGEFDLPFGFEMVYGPKYRWFMERTMASRSFFPGEPDVGMRLSGGLGFARYSLAVTNGEPLDEKSGLGLQDPNRNKDVTARFGAETKPSDDFVVAGGVSFNAGRGFTPGMSPSKTVLSWTDTNNNGVVDATELTGATGATQPSTGYARWAVGADLELLLRTKLGWSMLYAELVAASNLDRGFQTVNPLVTGNVRELSYYVALTQELGKHAVVGFRYDMFDPNSDLLESRAGKTVPISQQVTTYSPLVGFVLPDHARLLLQWDIVDDYLARDARGVPSDLKNNQWTLRLQGML